MTLKLTDTTANFKSIASGLLLPIDMTSVQHILLFGGTVNSANSLYNWASSSAAAATTGGSSGPTGDAQSVTCLNNSGSTGGWINTNTSLTANFSIMSVSRPLGLQQVPIISDNASSSGSGAVIWAVTGSNLYPYFGSDTQNGGLASDTLAPNAGYRALSFRRNDSTLLQYRNDYTAGSRPSTYPTPAGTFAASGRTLRIGADYNGSASISAATQHILSIVFNRWLTEAEDATLYQWVKAYCAQLPTPVAV